LKYGQQLRLLLAQHSDTTPGKPSALNPKPDAACAQVSRRKAWEAECKTAEQKSNQIKSSSAEHGFGLKFDLQKAGQWSAPLSTTNADVLVAPKNMSGTPSDSCTKGMRQASVESASRTRPEIQVF